MDWNKLTDDERVIAEQAVATFRAARLAGERAPHGHGLAHLEQAAREHGDALLRDTPRRAADARDAAPKKGLAPELPVRGRGQVQAGLA